MSNRESDLERMPQRRDFVQNCVGEWRAARQGQMGRGGTRVAEEVKDAKACVLGRADA